MNQPQTVTYIFVKPSLPNGKTMLIINGTRGREIWYFPSRESTFELLPHILRVY